MMSTLRSLPLLLLAKGQTFCASRPATPPQTRTGRIQIASSAFVGTMLLSHTAMAAAGGNSRQRLVGLIESVTGFLLVLLAAAVILMAIWGAILYVTAEGSGRASKAQKTIRNVAIGLGLAAGIFLLRQVVLDIVGGVDKGGNGGKLRNQLQKGKIGN